MGKQTAEAFQSACDQLERDDTLDQWRQLSHEVLTALVEEQGLMIALQRRALAEPRPAGEHARALRDRAADCFAVVKRLNVLRRRIQAVISDRRVPVILLAS